MPASGDPHDAQRLFEDDRGGIRSTNCARSAGRANQSPSFAMDTEFSDQECALIAQRISNGSIVPFFGAGASVSRGLPSGSELTRILSEAANFPLPRRSPQPEMALAGQAPASGESRRRSEDLSLVASYLVQQIDSAKLSEELRKALSKNDGPGRLHTLLGAQKALLLYVTTNYDNLIEAAMAERRPHVVVDHGNSEKVWLRNDPESEWEEVVSKDLVIAKTEPVVLKLHGNFDPKAEDYCKYLITEEDYIEYLGRPEGGQVPPALNSRMLNRSFLFLGYGLQDWNIRVLLHRLAEQRRKENKKILSWAIVRDASDAERDIWKRHDVRVFNVDLNEFATRLEGQLERLAATQPR
jgi:NAD-dependent SIR2 family protein deacetylase